MFLHAEALFSCYTKQTPPQKGKVAEKSYVQSSRDDNPNEGSNKVAEM